MDNWETPKWVMEMFQYWFDPCPLDPNPKEDGLKKEWFERTYVNPPYSNPLPWVKKAIEENKKGKTIVMLLNFDSSTKWFKLLFEANAHFLYFAERLKFSGKGSNPKASMLAILSVNSEKGADE